MEAVMALKGLRKEYPGFVLDNIDLTLPAGSIMGFVGENGAGKTTTIKTMLNICRKDGGEACFFGLDMAGNEREIKSRLGVVLDESMFHDTLRVTDIDKILSRVYPHKWDGSLYSQYIREFQLPEKKLVKDYSRGMKMKLSIAAALSHHPQLLILDEATSGLDPIMREEILAVFQRFVAGGEGRAVFLSSHITSDLEKVADRIAFIHQGRLVFCEEKAKLGGSIEELMLDYVHHEQGR